MAEAPKESVQSTNSLDMRATLAQAFETTLLDHMASENLRLAQVRTEEANIEVGTVDVNSAKESSYIVKPGDRVVATFGKTKAVQKGDATVITTPAVQPHELDLPKITQNVVNNVKTFDVESEFKKLRSITDTDERENAAQLLFMNIGQQTTVAQQRIRSIAAQRSGVADAQASLDQNIALDLAAIQTGKIRPGDTTTQTTQARAALAAAMEVANRYETDLVKQDPDIQRLADYRNLLLREFGQIDKAQGRKEARDSQLPVLTDSRLANAKYALGLTETNTGKLHNAVANSLLKDKDLNVVIDATKQDFPALLVHPSAKVRRYAYNIIAGFERENLGLQPNEELPGYVKALEPLVADRTAILRSSTLSDEAKLMIKAGEKKKGTAIGEKEKTEITNSTLLQVLTKEIEDTAKLKYQDMGKWSFQDPQFRQIVDTLKTNTLGKQNKGKVLMSDGIAEVMKAELKNLDGSKMTPQQKIGELIRSLDLSMSNDQRSAILPSVENYSAVMATQVRNLAMAAFVREANKAFFGGYAGLVNKLAGVE